jgi:hypothetical protein
MAPRPTIKLVDNPVAVAVAVGDAGDPLGDAGGPAASAPPIARERAPAPARGSALAAATGAAPPPDGRLPAGQGETNPYAGLRKIQAPVRLFPPLWDGLEELVRALQAEQLEVDKTALLNAVLHFHGPQDLADARELVNRWRALLARPPEPRR